MALAKLAGRESIPNSSSDTCVSMYRHGGMDAESWGILSLPAKPQFSAVGVKIAGETSWGSSLHFSVLAHKWDTDTEKKTGKQSEGWGMLEQPVFWTSKEDTWYTKVLRKAKCTQVSTTLLFNYCLSWCQWEISKNVWFSLCCPTCFAKRGYHSLPLRNTTYIYTWCFYFLYTVPSIFRLVTNEKNGKHWGWRLLIQMKIVPRYEKRLKR